MFRFLFQQVHYIHEKITRKNVVEDTEHLYNHKWNVRFVVDLSAMCFKMLPPELLRPVSEQSCVFL